MAKRRVVIEHRLPAGQTICVVQGDLTEEPVDAIVNAANERLAHGGGVAGAIVRRGGREIQEQSDRWVAKHGPVSTGSAAITAGGRLPCRFVIHAVGPVWGSGDEENKLAGAVRSALEMAERHELATISMPGISSGIFGFPKKLCATVMIRTVNDYLESKPNGPLQTINLCNIDSPTVDIFATEARRLLGL
jgi:O-acetyl-ADP-ribose deacetylase